MTGKSEAYLPLCKTNNNGLVLRMGIPTLSLGTKRYICIPYDVLVQTQVDVGDGVDE